MPCASNANARKLSGTEASEMFSGKLVAFTSGGRVSTSK
jgi:hypothetical protein